MLIQTKTAEFINDITGETCYIKPLPKPDDKKQYQVGTYYPIGEFLYKYIGRTDTLANITEGTIGMYDSKYFVNTFDDLSDNAEAFRIKDVVMADINTKEEMDLIVSNYVNKFISGKNIAKESRGIVIGDGSDIVITAPSDEDDPLTRLVKKMLIHKQISRREYKRNMTNGYELDNLISALNGSTKSTTITKFLMWCEVLNVDWEFVLVDNGDLEDYPLPKDIVLSKTKPIVRDIDIDAVPPSIFMVPIVDTDDPLKTLIKAALIDKQAPFSSYKDKGSKPYQINNMRSALKSKAKMMIDYFTNWCEVLGMYYIFRVTDPKDGTVFEASVFHKIHEYNEDTLIK